MIFDRQGTTTIITQEFVSIPVFLERMNESYPKFKDDNIIINLFSFNDVSLNDILEFAEISATHKNSKKSFVIVTDKVNYDDIPEEFVVVPTLQEAFDIIEMDEIERDLGF